MGRSISAVTTRRQFLEALALTAGAGLLARNSVFAWESGIVPTMINAAAKAKVTVQPIRRNISVLQGSGGNIAVLTGRDGKLLVDAGFAVSRSAVSNALASIDDNPVTHLINTHWHIDHTDGNAWLHSARAEIIAHQNTKRHLSVSTRVEGCRWTFPPAPAGALPSRVFDTDHVILRNNTQIALCYYGPAHTDSDILVHFTEADIVHLGDTWWNGDYPFIDYSTGGSIAGQIQAAEANLSKFSDQTIFIPGHGPVGKRADVAEYRDMLVAVRTKVAALKRQGRSLQDTIAANPTAQFDAKWGQFLTTPDAFTGFVYAGV
jgi:glyoxylase-like metal-dependent hydrolase (beta-lactamase superfamily II)